VDRKVSDPLYQACARHFGEKGVVDLIMLAGCYLMICSLLNVFEIPAPISDPLTRKEA
jgi:4-carboxymuconolactone decarboxylase